MAKSERRVRGEEMIAKVYAGDVVTPPEGQSAFVDLMLEQLFAEVWTREELSIRDRRLILLGIIAEKGEPLTFGLQIRATGTWSESPSPASMRVSCAQKPSNASAHPQFT